MRLKILAALVLIILSSAHAARDAVPPEGFVHLRQVAPDIVQDIRYFGPHNFLGRPVTGYEAAECVLTVQAAEALKAVNDELAPKGLALKVYDCYRPARAVDDFVKWSRAASDQAAKAEFYPNVDKKDFFELGYVAKRSGHSRGSTVDVTVVRLPAAPGEPYAPGQPLKPCTAPHGQRFDDGSLDMGTGFDCMDELSHSLSPRITGEARENRMLLREAMVRHGFKPYEYEWWHFTLAGEPYPDTYFDFPVTAPGK